MRILLLPMLLIAQVCLGQTSEDYSIYSMLIDKQMSDWKLNDDTSKVIAITDRLTSFSSRINLKDYNEALFGSDKQLAYVTANYKDSICKLLNNSEFQDLFKLFANNFNYSRHLESKEFILRYQVELLDKNYIEKLFDHSEIVNYKKAWKRFYKDHPNSPGYFEISNIEYSDNFALLYVVHRAKPLIGGGQVIILKKVNESWTKYDYLTIWYD